METKLLGQRQTFHVSIRTEKKNQNIQKRRNYFISNVFGEKVQKVKEKVEEIKNMIVEGKVNDQNIAEFLSTLVNVIRYDTKMKDVGENIQVILGYLVNVYEKIKNQKDAQKKMYNILEVVNNITFFAQNIEPYERQVFNIAQQCIQKLAYKRHAILLLTNLSSFDFYPEMTQYMSSQQFFNSLTLVIQDLPLSDTQKQNIVDFYTNLLLDNNSNKTTLLKYITILYMLIEYNTDTVLSLKIIKTLKLLIRQNYSIVHEHDFEQIVCVILMDNIETNDKNIKSELLDLLRIVVKKSNLQLSKALLDKGLYPFILNCIQTQQQKNHNIIVKMMIEIIYISQSDIKRKQKVEMFLTHPVLQYVKSYYQFGFPQIKESILQLMINFNIQKIMNQPQFFQFLENFSAQRQTPQSHKKLLRIIENVIEKQDSQQTIVLHQIIIKVLEQLSLLQNGNQTVKDEALRLLSYVEDKPE